MRVLVNYSKEEKPQLAALAYILRDHNVTGMYTAADMTIGEMLAKAQSIKASAILLTNEQTLRYCVPGEKPTVDKWRGSRLNFSIPTIVLNKLGHIHTVPHGEWLIRKDIAKLQHVHKPSVPFSFTVLKTIQDCEPAYQDMRRAFCLYYDIETSTGKPKEVDSINIVGETVITCVSWTAIFLDGRLKTYVLPLINFGVDYWESNKEYGKALAFMRRVNALPNTKAMHNGMYDATHSIRYNAEPNNWTYDTMAMAHAEFSELPKTIDFVCSYNCYDYIFWKDQAESASRSKDIEAYWGYNAKDTWWGARILIEQLRHAPAYAFTNYAKKFRMVYPSLYGNFEGLQIDNTKRKELRSIASTKLEKAKTQLRIIFADPNFNPGSWQQVEKYIYRVFGAKKPNIGKSKSSTDEKNLIAVGEQHPLLERITSDIINYREAQKAIGTYYDFLQYKDRLLWALNPFGTETGRMACTSSSLWCGTQVQNIPGYAKHMLVADPGYELFEADNKQSEGRTTAYCSQEEALIAALEDATRDFYKTLGTLFFNIPYEDVSDFFRNKVLKKIVHGTNYMMGAKTFIENIGVRILYETADKIGVIIADIPKSNTPNAMPLKKFAASLLESYHKPFPRVKLWYKELYAEIQNTGRLVSPEGHVRRFFGDITKNHNMLRGAVAHQPQNLSVSILDKGLLRVYTELVLPGNGDIRIKAQIHDSIFGQWRIEKRDYYAPRVLECMRNPVTVHGRTLIIPVDIKYGNNWAERDTDNTTGTVKWKLAKKERNPNE